ncbi:MAG: nucleotidyltransferase domain-containing protein [Chitinispirillales bacterium]|jgi:predicted nucleotidyltransferase|nr:nucleotidyltransferase domain-containing protein [Chitinispirillales bacterium]
MLTLNKISEVVKTVAPQYEINQVYLFGSYARGDATEESDVDFRIVGGNIPSLFTMGGLYEDLAEPLGTRVDLVMTKNMSEKFYSYIKDEELLIYAKL